MQTSIRFLSLVVMAMLVTVLSVPGHAHPGGGKGSEKSFRGIELTETQREALREAMAETRDAHREAMREARESGDRGKVAALRREHARAMREAISEVLDEEQLAELRERRESWRERRFERFSERLELDPAQMDAVREILGEARREVRATLRERHQALADAGQDRAEIRAALRAGREEMRSEIRERLAAVLTPEQLETFETMRRDGERRKGKRQLRQRDRS